jgi:hypothetical protein
VTREDAVAMQQRPTGLADGMSSSIARLTARLQESLDVRDPRRPTSVPASKVPGDPHTSCYSQVDLSQ